MMMAMFLMAVVPFTFTSCGDDDDEKKEIPDDTTNPLIGVWQMDEEEQTSFIQFNADGTWRSLEIEKDEEPMVSGIPFPVTSGTWRLDGETLTLIQNLRFLDENPSIKKVPIIFNETKTAFTMDYIDEDAEEETVYNYLFQKIKEDVFEQYVQTYISWAESNLEGSWTNDINPSRTNIKKWTFYVKDKTVSLETAPTSNPSQTTRMRGTWEVTFDGLVVNFNGQKMIFDIEFWQSGGKLQIGLEDRATDDDDSYVKLGEE